MWSAQTRYDLSTGFGMLDHPSFAEYVLPITTLSYLARGWNECNG